MPMVDVGRGKLSAEVYGPAAAAPVLLVAGGGGAMSSWLRLVPEVHPEVQRPAARVAPIAAPLTEDLRVAVFDQAGLGRSAAVAPATSMAEAAADAVAVGTALLGSRFAVAGFSLGGAAVIHMALHHSDNVTAVLIGCSYPGVSEFVAPVPPDEADPPSDRSISRRFIEAHASMISTIEHIRDSTQRHPDADEASIHLFLSHDHASLHAIRTPCAVLCGTDDEVFPSANSELIAARIPSSTLVLLPGVGHAMHLEAPDAVAVALRALVARA